jgi:rhodopsin domain-containing protein
VFLIYGVHWGLGQRLEGFNLIAFGQINKWSLFIQVIMFISLSFSKMAVVAFLQRMHGPHDRNRVIFLWTVAGSNTIMNLIAMALMLTQCTPTAKMWDNLQPGSCESISRTQDYGYVRLDHLYLDEYKIALADLPRLVCTLRFYSCSLPDNFLLGSAAEEVCKDQLMYVNGTRHSVSFLHKRRHLAPNHVYRSGICSICKTVKLQALGTGGILDIPGNLPTVASQVLRDAKNGQLQTLL